MAKQILPVPNSTESRWRSGLHPLDEYRSTEKLPSECDIAIVGAGMSGVSVAYHLLELYDEEDRPSITLLDARQLCSGATGRNGGHVKCKTDSLLEAKKKHGVAFAEELAAFVDEHIYAIKAVVEKEELECEFELRRSFDVFLDEEQARNVERDFKESLKNGERWTRNCSLLSHEHLDQVTSIPSARAAFSVPACSLNPYRFVSQLLSRLAPKLNIQLLTPVTHISPCPLHPSRTLLSTPRGNLSAKVLILATNAYTPGLLPVFLNKITPTLAFASHLHPLPPKGSEGVAGHLSNTYNLSYAPAAAGAGKKRGTDYLNPRPDGSVVLGGGNWTYAERKEEYVGVWDDSKVIDGPEKHFGEVMGENFRGWGGERTGLAGLGGKVEKVWSGVIGRTGDGWPYVGRIPGEEGKGKGEGGRWVIAGFNGGGMPLIFLSAKGLARMVKEGVKFAESGVPGLFEVTAERLGI